jgi:hypothetical protein
MNLFDGEIRDEFKIDGEDAGRSVPSHAVG